MNGSLILSDLSVQKGRLDRVLTRLSRRAFAAFARTLSWRRNTFASHTKRTKPYLLTLDPYLLELFDRCFVVQARSEVGYYRKGSVT